MGEQEEIATLEGLLDKICRASEGRDRVSLNEVFKAAGRRSFGPMLLVPGLIAFSPLSGIPGMPTLVGLMVMLVTSQLLLGRSEFWVPQFVLRRSISRPSFEKAMKVLRKVARFIDRLLKPRLTFLTKGPAMYATAALFLLLSIATPFMELLPFVITGVGGAVSAFGLALISHDGLLAILAVGFCAVAVTVAIATAFQV